MSDTHAQFTVKFCPRVATKQIAALITSQPSLIHPAASAGS